MIKNIRERCDLCDCPTGEFCGSGESIYRDVIAHCEDWDGYRFTVGATIGPLCSSCCSQLEEAGIIGDY